MWTRNKVMNMKNKKLLRLFSIVAIVLLAIAEILTLAIVLKTNMLPAKYTIVVAVVFFVLLLGVGMFLFVRGKKPVSAARTVIACVLALAIVCMCAAISKVASDAYGTIQSVTGGSQENDIRDIYVLVKLEDPAKSLADAKDYSFAIIQDYDKVHTQQAITVVGETIGATPVIAQYETAAATADALLGGQVDAIMLNGASMALLFDEEGYEDFEDKIRILHTIDMDTLEPTTPTEESRAPEEITQKPFVVYISGSDTRSKKLKVSRSDVNILVSVNPTTKQILLLNTPRDYYIPNPAGDGALDKLTHCGLYGTKNSIKALSDLYGIKVDYFAQINFTGFETLIDAVDGVTIYSDASFTARDTKIKEGENHLTGAQALDLARERRKVKGGDNGRGKNQMKVIKALIEKLTTGTTVISKYSEILDSLSGMFTTDISTAEITAFVKMQLDDMATWNIQTFAVTGSGATEKNYSGSRAYVMKPHEHVVAHASTLVNKVLNGETLTEEDMKAPKK